MRFLLAKVAPVATPPVMALVRCIRLGKTGITLNRNILRQTRIAGEHRGLLQWKVVIVVAQSSVPVVLSTEVSNE